MDDHLLTKEQLADRWQVKPRTIENYERDGIIARVPGLPVPRYSLKAIAEVEGVELEMFSPLMKKKMQRELDRVTKERDELKAILSRITGEASKFISREV